MVKKIIIILVFLMISLSTLVGCNTLPETDIQGEKSQLTINGTGIASSAPDIVDIQFGVDTLNDNPVDAVNENSKKMDAVMLVLDQMGIEQVDIKTVYYNMWVEDVYDQDGQLTGEKRYRLTNQVNIRLGEMDKIGLLIENVISAGATSINGITFGVSDTSELEQEAMENAIINAKEKASRVADELGVSLGEISTLFEGGSYSPPVPYYGEKGGVGGGSAVPISQGQFSVTVQVQVVYDLLPEQE